MATLLRCKWQFSYESALWRRNFRQLLKASLTTSWRRRGRKDNFNFCCSSATVSRTDLNPWTIPNHDHRWVENKPAWPFFASFSGPGSAEAHLPSSWSDMTQLMRLNVNMAKESFIAPVRMKMDSSRSVFIPSCCLSPFIGLLVSQLPSKFGCCFWILSATLKCKWGHFANQKLLTWIFTHFNSDLCTQGWACQHFTAAFEFNSNSTFLCSDS